MNEQYLQQITSVSETVYNMCIYICVCIDISCETYFASRNGKSIQSSRGSICLNLCNSLYPAAAVQGLRPQQGASNSNKSEQGSTRGVLGLSWAFWGCRLCGLRSVMFGIPPRGSKSQMASQNKQVGMPAKRILLVVSRE